MTYLYPEVVRMENITPGKQAELLVVKYKLLREARAAGDHITMRRLKYELNVSYGQMCPAADFTAFYKPDLAVNIMDTASAVLERLKGRLVDEHHIRTDGRARALLGMWVSELEPAFVYGHDFELLGITNKGNDKITISVDRVRE